jgi:uncharacterized repeat protein (TIGR01451 family)
MAMSSGFWVRRMTTAGVLAALAAAGVVAVGTPASADTPAVTVAVSPSTVSPGDTVTVTETITNTIGSTILQPTAELFSGPDFITDYTTLTSCDAGPGGSCTAATDGSGDVFGYRAVFGSALGGSQSATATFTLTVDANADSATETLIGDLAGANFDSGQVPGPTLTIDAKADLAVALSGTPVRNGLLGENLDFTITVTNNGPGTAQAATITATVPDGLPVRSSACQAHNGGAVCTIGPLASGHQTTATFTVAIGLLDLGIPFQFGAARTSSTPVDPNAANDTASDTCTVVSVLLASCTA